MKRGGGGEGGNLVYGSLSSSFMAFFICFTVMSEYSLDDPGFTPPVPPGRLHRRNHRWKLPLMVGESVHPVPGG